jgi:large subunit ribosomal protein L18
MILKKSIRALRRKKRVKSKIFGTGLRPRLSVFRSNRSLFAQIIDDQKGETLVSVSEKEIKDEKVTKSEKAKLLGELLAQKAAKKKIERVIFDRSSYKYHGRIKAFAEGAKEKGLTI